MVKALDLRMQKELPSLMSEFLTPTTAISKIGFVPQSLDKKDPLSPGLAQNEAPSVYLCSPQSGQVSIQRIRSSENHHTLKGSDSNPSSLAAGSDLSSQGHTSEVDPSEPPMSFVYSPRNMYGGAEFINSLSISSTGNFLGFGTNMGSICVFQSGSNMKINNVTAISLLPHPPITRLCVL